MEDQWVCSRWVSVANGDSGLMRKSKFIHIGLDLRSANPCKVTIWFEDVATHELALEVCQEVAEQIDPRLIFDFTGWRLEDLSEPAQARQAIRAAANADIVLISTRGSRLPPKTRECLEACAGTRTKSDGALAWLVVGSGGAASAETDSLELRQTASRLGMDFLPPGVFRDSPEPSGQRSDLEIATLASLQENDSRGYFHWGLNE